MRADKVYNFFGKIVKTRSGAETGSTTSQQNPGFSTASSEGVLPAPSARRLPPLVGDLAGELLPVLCQRAQDYQIVHGGILKTSFPWSNGPQGCVAGQTLGVSLHPSPFPRALFEEACQLQTLFQKLYVAIAEDPEWMRVTLNDVIESDDLTRTIWSVYEAVRMARVKSSNTGGKISAAILRSDYMLNANTDNLLELKQVEVNTISCAGAAHGQRTADMHRYLHKSGSYHDTLDRSVDASHAKVELDIPRCKNIQGICDVLTTAHRIYSQTYTSDRSSARSGFCILMVVQPRNFNIADERPIEYALWDSDPPIPCYRVEWGKEMMETTTLTSSGTLLFKTPFSGETYEVSVVYYRAGFEDREYTGPSTKTGFEARMRFELSNAVQCPDILTQLAGCKKVQQALCASTSLERFVSQDDARRLRRTFMEMLPLDLSAAGGEGRHVVNHPNLVQQYVLKPSKEGGGHNFYRSDIKAFLDTVPSDNWSQFILMKLIDPVVSNNILASSNGIWVGDTVAELGIWGGCVWIHGDKPDMVMNSQIGWSVRSKNPGIDEMSVVKGYGCFDSVALVDRQSGD